MNQRSKKILKPIMLLIATSICCFAYYVPITFDATHNKNNSLSTGNIKLLSKIEKPLQIELFTLDKNIGEQVHATISQFQEKNKNVLFKINHAPLTPEKKIKTGFNWQS